MKCAWKELLAILPLNVRQEVDRQGRDTLQEIRIRLGKPWLLIRSNGSLELKYTAQKDDIQFVIHAASQYSPWTVTTLSQGYLTAAGGHRIGVCGQALVRNGSVDGIGVVTSLNIRIARDFPGISSNLWLRRGNILILGPPGCGKTTLLRDLIRKRSNRETISVVDERGEIFPMAAGFDAGPNTDILTGFRKDEGISNVLRAMNPVCIAVDEITAEADCEALIRAAWCGVSLLATAHASSISDLNHRPVYQPLLKTGLFEFAVILEQDKSWHTERIDI